SHGRLPLRQRDRGKRPEISHVRRIDRAITEDNTIIIRAGAASAAGNGAVLIREGGVDVIRLVGIGETAGPEVIRIVILVEESGAATLKTAIGHWGTKWASVDDSIRIWPMPFRFWVQIQIVKRDDRRLGRGANE